MKASQIGAIVLALSGLMTFTANAADIEAGKEKSAVCAACHGADGNSSNAAWQAAHTALLVLPASMSAAFAVNDTRQDKAKIMAPNWLAFIISPDGKRTEFLGANVYHTPAARSTITRWEL